MSKKFRVTQEELDSLAQPLQLDGPGGVDKGFRWRTIFLLVATVIWVLRLLFYPTEVLEAIHVVHTAVAADFQYLRLRAFAAIAVLLVYMISYLKDWLFPQVALIVFSIVVTGLGIDAVVFYMYFDQPVSMEVAAYVVLSCMGVVCLFYNALRAQRAPPMPRKLWS